MPHRSTRHEHQPSGCRRFLVRYRFEITWGLAVGLGLFLVFERLNIRSTLKLWLQAAALGLSHAAERFFAGLAAVSATLTVSNVIGLLLLAAALIALLLRIRQRVMQSPTATALKCPKCGGSIYRIHRRTSDRLLSLFVPVRRYRCADQTCGWHGLRVGTGRSSGKHSSQQTEPPPATNP